MGFLLIHREILNERATIRLMQMIVRTQVQERLIAYLERFGQQERVGHLLLRF